jgi:hypothetical protein
MRQQIPNRELAADAARANLLPNGGFEIWQRGAGAFTADNATTADRWVISKSGTDTISVTSSNGNADTANGSQLCAAVTFTLGSGGGATSLYQYLKASDGHQLAGRTVSVSVRVKTSTASAARLSIYDGTTWFNGSFHTGGGAYETLSMSLAIPTSATFVGVRIPFSVSCTAYLDNAMLVVGSVPADYAPMHPADDLARCMRYYERVLDNSSNVLFTYGGAGNNGYFFVPFKVQKAIAPTVTKSGTWALNNCAQPTVYTADALGVTLQAVITATAAFFVQPNVVNALVAEANP